MVLRFLLAALLLFTQSDTDRAISRLFRDLRFALEGGSAPGVMALIDKSKLTDALRFQDTIERLLREDTVRASFQVIEQASPTEDKIVVQVDAEMELARKDAAGQAQRRRRIVRFELERGRKGWRITEISPRDYFAPL